MVKERDVTFATGFTSVKLLNLEFSQRWLLDSVFPSGLLPWIFKNSFKAQFSHVCRRLAN